MKKSLAVVIPARNAERYIARAIQSVLNQSRPADEIIVVDDCSTDRTREIVLSFSPRVRLLSGQGAGSGPARNLGVYESNCDFIAFLDADDFWDPEKLLIQSEYLSEGQVVCCSAVFLSATGNEVGHSVAVQNSIGANEYLNAGRGVPALLSSWIVSRKDFYDVAGFDPVYRFAQDFDLLIRLSLNGCKLAYVNKPLVFYQLHSKSESALAHKMQYFTAQYLKERHIFKSTEKPFDEWLSVATKVQKLRRHAFAGRLFRIGLLNSGKLASIFVTPFFLIVSFILHPSRFLHKLRWQYLPKRNR